MRIKEEVLWLSMCLVFIFAWNAKADLVWTDDFTSSTLNSRWVAECGPASTPKTTSSGVRINNGARLEGGLIYFDNEVGKYSHIQTPINGNKVAAVVGSVYTWEGSASYMQPSIAIYWDIANWVSFQVDPIGGSSGGSTSRFTRQTTINGVYTRTFDTVADYDPRANQWYTLKIAIEDGQLKFYYAEGHSLYDAGVNLPALTMALPSSFAGENALLIYGKGTGTQNSGVPLVVTNEPTLNNGHSTLTYGPTNYIRGSDISYYEIPEPASIMLLCIGGIFLSKAKSKMRHQRLAGK